LAFLIAVLQQIKLVLQLPTRKTFFVILV